MRCTRYRSGGILTNTTDNCFVEKAKKQLNRRFVPTGDDLGDKKINFAFPIFCHDILGKERKWPF